MNSSIDNRSLKREEIGKGGDTTISRNKESANRRTSTSGADFVSVDEHDSAF